MDGFSDSDFIDYRFLIYNNVIKAMHQLLEGAVLLKILVDVKIQVRYSGFLLCIFQYRVYQKFEAKFYFKLLFL